MMIRLFGEQRDTRHKAEGRDKISKYEFTLKLTSSTRHNGSSVSLCAIVS
jgi:hypothetical protein